MNRPVRFSFDRLPVSRWRNGGGETREIASWCGDGDATSTAGDFAWRASIATIDRNGEFSAFPGVDRIITLLEGDGVVLQGVPGRAHSLTRHGEPYAFAGEDPITAVLAGGPSRDFNIMTRRRDWRAAVSPHRREILLPSGHDGVVYILAGLWRIDGDDVSLAARDGCWWTSLSAPLRLTPTSADALALWADIAAR